MSEPMTGLFMRSVFRSSISLLAACAAWGQQLPDGPGKAETVKLCSQCHEIERSVSLKQGREGWQGTIEKMITMGAKGTDAEWAAVLDYLAKNYPADEVPKVNVNQASAIELESGLSLRRSEAAAVIRYREKNGAFHSIEELKKVPGIDAAKIESKKDRLAF
jgi:competence protein ComEA